jgi:prepilin-type N-terminal cleavage/methylation domain-containing protein
MKCYSVRREGKSGFTLIELLIVIAVLGILSAIAVPLYLGQRTKAMATEARSNLEVLGLLEAQFFAENGVYTPDPDGTREYKGTHSDASDNGLEDILPGFRPGNLADLNYDYKVTTDGNGTSFIANATGKDGTLVEGNYVEYNQNNEWGP